MYSPQTGRVCVKHARACCATQWASVRTGQAENGSHLSSGAPDRLLTPSEPLTPLTQRRCTCASRLPFIQSLRKPRENHLRDMCSTRRGKSKNKKKTIWMSINSKHSFGEEISKRGTTIVITIFVQNARALTLRYKGTLKSCLNEHTVHVNCEAPERASTHSWSYARSSLRDFCLNCTVLKKKNLKVP